MSKLKKDSKRSKETSKLPNHSLEEILREYSTLFSGELGTMKGMEYEIELVDNEPVHSAPYHCAPPKLKVLKEIVQELQEQNNQKKAPW
jgi:hypothetical protein